MHSYNKKIRLTLEDQVKALTLLRFRHFFIFGVLRRESKKSEGNKSYSSKYHQKVNWLSTPLCM